MNYQRQVLLFTLFFLVSLIAATVLFHFYPSLAGSTLRPVNIVSEIVKDSASNGKKSVVTKNSKIVKGNIIVKDYLTEKSLINSSGDKFALQYFLKKLAALKKDKSRKVRIGYFGDSFIEGDLITQDLRKQLQDTLGGDGVGFVPIRSITEGFRQTIIQHSSGDWEEVSFKSDNHASAQLFLSGHKFFPGNNSSVSFRASNQPHLDHFVHAQVLYGKASNGNNTTGSISINSQSYTLHANDVFNVDEINLGNCQAVNMSASPSGIPIYGLSFETPAGIMVDNFSFRGISGVELDNFSEDYLRAMQAKRPYDLLVFQYGPNLLFKGELVEFKWYQKKMLPILQKLKKAFPQTSILLVSTADKGYKYAGAWRTQKGVEPLVDVQYDMANNAGLDFFNLYNAMGGENSMVKWATESPTLANKDYTHVNFRGAKKIADIIYNAIMKEFDDYQKHGD